MATEMTQFKLKKKIGEGKYGKAYRAIDSETGSTVCVKLIKKSDDG